MAGSANDIIECPGCGAVLSGEDLFCGECGAPRPGVDIGARAEVTPETRPEPVPGAGREPREGAAEGPGVDSVSVSEAAVPAPDAREARRPPPSPVMLEPAAPRQAATDVWRIVAIVVTALAITAACGLIMLGLLLGFVIPDPHTGQAATRSMISTASWGCFCPGALSLILAAVLWAVLLRKK